MPTLDSGNSLGDMSAELFESMYQSAQGDAATIPWASLSPNPFIAEWLQSCNGSGRTIVVGCGLGDDAEAASDNGWEVTAFDVAPSAIEWCKERFPDSTVAYSVQDLFDLPSQWSGAFSLVVEVLTVQSLAPALQADAIGRISALVAPRGSLLVYTFVHVGPQDQSGPPWPPVREDLEAFTAAGLVEVSFATRPSHWPGYELAEIEYLRPSA